MGNGVRTVMTQVAAEATGLGIEPESPSVSGDSLFPDAPYSGASQTTATVGSAVLSEQLPSGGPTIPGPSSIALPRITLLQEWIPQSLP